MKEFKELFKKISTYLTGTYIALFLIWLAIVMVQGKFGLGFLPFGIGKFVGYVTVVMFWLLVTPSKLILESTLFDWLPFPGAINQSHVAMYIVPNIINIILIILLSFILAMFKHTENFLIKKYGQSQL